MPPKSKPGFRKGPTPPKPARPSPENTPLGVPKPIFYVNKERRAPPVQPVLAAREAKLHPPPPPPVKPRSKVPLYLGGLALYGAVVYGAYLYVTTNHVVENSEIKAKPLSEQEDTSYVYTDIAKKYDSEIGGSELAMGMPILRRWMASRARGEVLEASAGTGRNMKYFPVTERKVKGLTFVDSNEPMLRIARKEFLTRYPKYAEKVRFLVQDAGEPMRTKTGERFDTVVQSMGMCSHHSPVKLLNNLGDACKDEGNIILLEHGKSHYEWLNRILDLGADKHAEKWGCWWNRDIEAILGESNLRVEKVSRYHFGTTYWIEAKPPLRNKDEGEKDEGEKERVQIRIQELEEDLKEAVKPKVQEKLQEKPQQKEPENKNKKMLLHDVEKE
ncbi:S-adenosyl-L-methionine-dependent methyltransferase [Pyronema omphalodes]|nr:S-adenosyl-L-methionine-dependent methyltransferase [Pyronema omphalodes]